MKKLTTYIMAVLLTLSVGISHAVAVTPNLNYLKNLSAETDMVKDWRAMALGSWGIIAEVGSVNNADCLDLSRNILARVAQKQSASTETDRLLTFYTNDQFGNPEQLNDDIFAVIALKGAMPSWSNAVALQNIANSQNADGSFAYKKGLSGDTDMTAAAIWALSLDSNFSAITNKAMQYLKTNQLENGSFSSTAGGSSNIASTTWALIALRTGNQNTSATENYLLSQMKSDGSWSVGNSASPLISSYAVLALSGKKLPFVGSFTNPSPSPAPASTVQSPTAQKTSPASDNNDTENNGTKSAGVASKKPPIKKKTVVKKTVVCRSEATSYASADSNGAIASASARVWCE